MTDIIKSTIELTYKAGQAILDIYKTLQVQTTYKEDNSPLTAADLASHKLLVAGLKEITPDIPVLSEESGSVPVNERQGWQRFWLIDPLDGTKEFIKRNGEFTVNIALIKSGTPIFGIVHAPVLNTTYWGISESISGDITVEQGAFKQIGNSEPAIIKAKSPKENKLKLVVSRSHNNAETTAFMEKLSKNFTVESLSIGSSLKLCLVAEGKAHIYPRFGPTMEWDTAAAQCVVEQAGGKVITLKYQPLRYNKDNLLNPYFIVSVEDIAWQEYL